MYVTEVCCLRVLGCMKCMPRKGIKWQIEDWLDKLCCIGILDSDHFCLFCGFWWCKLIFSSVSTDSTRIVLGTEEGLHVVDLGKDRKCSERSVLGVLIS